ncbi:MAG: hypothetical protein Q6359_06505 [Candidatus Brocadiales bacterium]|nr:hypothetical protein [Candidatus Brocadiales bacterium]
MKYNSAIHHRNSIRLKRYDYSQKGAYFVTICTHDGRPYFEEYPELRQIVTQRLQEIPDRFSGVTLDESVIMPNHVHVITIVGAALAAARKNVRATLAVARNYRAGARPAPTIGDIVGMFKSLCIQDWLKHIKQNNIDAVGKFWQRNYYEHIIRDEQELNKIREYIINNPLKWSLDRENPDRQGSNLLEDEIFNVHSRGGPCGRPK